MGTGRLGSRWFRLAAALAGTALLVGPLIWLWHASLLPQPYSMSNMGLVDHGQAEAPVGEHNGRAVTAGRSVSGFVVDRGQLDRATDVAAHDHPNGLFQIRRTGSIVQTTAPGPAARAPTRRAPPCDAHLWPPRLPPHCFPLSPGWGSHPQPAPPAPTSTPCTSTVSRRRSRRKAGCAPPVSPRSNSPGSTRL